MRRRFLSGIWVVVCHTREADSQLRGLDHVDDAVVVVGGGEGRRGVVEVVGGERGEERGGGNDQ